MKKLSMLVLSLLFIFLFTGCNGDEEQSKSETNESKTTATETTSMNNEENEHNHAANPNEPASEDLCYFCNMKIYTEEEDMGVFTAQAVKVDGTHVYFDDSGCLLNAQRKFNEEFANEWVRDYTTKEWVEAEKAVVVKADVQTPMKYGYAFFKDEDRANKYISENQTNGVVSSWDPIDQESAKRFEMKMKKEAEAKAAEGENQSSENMNMNQQ